MLIKYAILMTSKISRITFVYFYFDLFLDIRRTNCARLSTLLFATVRVLKKRNYILRQEWEKNSNFTYSVKKKLVSLLLREKRSMRRMCTMNIHYSWYALQMPKRNCIPACEKDEGEPRNSKGLIMRGRVGIRMDVNPRIVFVKSNAILWAPNQLRLNTKLYFVSIRCGFSSNAKLHIPFISTFFWNLDFYAIISNERHTGNNLFSRY